MKKFFFYKNKQSSYKSIKKNEINIIVKKLIKIKFTNSTFSYSFKQKFQKKNFCLITGYKRSVNSLFYLSRMCLKEQFRNRLLQGLKKIS